MAPPAKRPEQIKTVKHFHSLRMACLYLSHTNPCIICISEICVPFVWTLPPILHKTRPHIITHTIYSNTELDVKKLIYQQHKNSIGLHCYDIIYFAPSFFSWQEKLTYFPPKKYLWVLTKKSRSMGVVLIDL